MTRDGVNAGGHASAWDPEAGHALTPGEGASLSAAVAAVFTEQGPLARHGEYRWREAQDLMAQAVAQAIECRDTLVVEAGTGVGKTYAYLVPVLMSGRRAIISTATKSLQEQLFLRDLPRVINALHAPVQAALLKGRESYLCLHRLKQARHSDLHGGAANTRGAVSIRSLARIERWAAATTSGDMAEVEGLDEGSPVLPLVTSTRDNCLGSSCPDFQACHVVRARREAMAAQVVVVNHHLFFADLKLRDTGVAELLPTVDVVVFDEAHHVVDTGVQFMGLQLSTAQLVDLSRDILALGMKLARGLDDWPLAAQGIERPARDLRLALGGANPARLRWADALQPETVAQALAQIEAGCATAAEMLGTCSELDPAFDQLVQRAREQADRASHFTQPPAAERVRWIDTSAHHARLIEAPLDIADDMKALRQRADRAWIFTSATLGDDNTLSWFTKPAGLSDATILRLGSPYDHAANARLWVCNEAPRPDDMGHAAYVAGVAAACAQRLGGRTLVLTTTLRAMARIADALRDTLRHHVQPIDVAVQGQEPKRLLLQRLRERPNTVLVASQSFWEGIDVPGDALQCVIIDKLPFPPPNDPLVEARAARVERDGGSAFNTCFLADTAVSLMHGAGRLIRSESDRGLLVVCDPRMARMSYGARLRRALPPMTAVTSSAEALAWLDEIAVNGATPIAPLVAGETLAASERAAW